MSDPVSSCHPEHLTAYADAMERLNSDLLGTATHLGRQLDTFFNSCSEFPVAVDRRLADPLARLAHTAAERDEWVRTVAVDFIAADRGASEPAASAQSVGMLVAAARGKPKPSPEAVLDKAIETWEKILGRELTAEEKARLEEIVWVNDGVEPRIFKDSPRNPAIDAYAEHALDQYPIYYQNVLIGSMDENSTLAVRSRPPGAYLFDTVVKPKDKNVTDPMILFKYPDGRRLIVRNGALETVLSDIDIADYVVDDVWVEDEVFIGPDGYMATANEAFGVDNIQHGPLTRGLVDPEIIKKIGGYNKETGEYIDRELIINFFQGQTVLVFQKKAGSVGFVGEIALIDYLQEYNKEALAAIEQALPPDMWKDIINRRQY